MVKSGDDLGVAPFLKKCYEMVDDDSTDSIISWSSTDESFIIWDLNQFSVQLLPKYFKHNNSSSFIRQLNIYGFKKVDADRWEFANDGFIKGKKHLMKNITRRKNAQATENRKLSQQQESSGEPGKKTDNNEGLWKEIENLKTDKNVLMQELVKLRQFQESADNKLVLLKDRFQGMEKNQQQMLSFLVMVVQNPGFLMQLFNPKENNWRMADPGTIVEEEIDEEQLATDKMLVRYQPLAEEMTTPKVTEIPQESESESDPFCDGMKDPVVCPDFVKFLMDENFSVDNYAPFVLPEIRDESTWEQIFFGSHFLQDANGGNQDGEVGNTENETQVEPCSMEQVDKFQSLEENSGKTENLEIVTKKMACLASESHQEE